MKRSLMAVLKFLGVWGVAALLTTGLAVIFQSQNLMSRLNGLGAEIGLGDRLSMTLYDLMHFGSVYLPFIAVATLVAFLAALLVYRLAGFGRPVVFAVAGGVAMVVMLALMKQAFFGVQLVGGARDGTGFAFQILAGVIGGLVFAGLSRPRPDPEPAPAVDT
ncbi:MAG: hypothetical protein WBG08_05145 [Litorimonas sp.]